MKNSEKYNKAFDYFKKEYNYKMGGEQTVILPNGKEKYFDDRKYYQGRGEKYNDTIKHDKFVVKVSKKEYTAFLKQLKEKEIAKAKYKEEKKLKESRILQANKEGIYSIICTENGSTYIELSDKEIFDKIFDEKRLAKTLNIKVEDAILLKSIGKTYVFAKVNNSNKILELYHSDLSCNNLSIHFSEINEERMKEFNHEKWLNAPYARTLGMSNENKNHFVC